MHGDWDKAAAAAVVVLCVLFVVVAPFAIGKPRQPLGGGAYVYGLAVVVLELRVCGRVLGWW